MSDREAFTKAFTVPDDAVYNVVLNKYCWRSHPSTAHPFDATYEGWCAGWCESKREIERLTKCLEGANEQAKHFEREWYLRGDEIEKLLSIKPHISEGIFGYGLRNDDGSHLSMDDTDEIAEYIMTQAAQAQASERSCTCHPDDSPPVPCAKKYALTDCQATPPAAVPERKCSECGNGEPKLSLYCVRCLNNDGWYLGEPPAAVLDKETLCALFSHYHALAFNPKSDTTELNIFTKQSLQHRSRANEISCKSHDERACDKAQRFRII